MNFAFISIAWGAFGGVLGWHKLRIKDPGQAVELFFAAGFCEFMGLSIVVVPPLQNLFRAFFPSS